MYGMSSLIDSHCHIDFPIFDVDRSLVIERARQVGVDAIVVPGTRQSAWEYQLELCRTNPMLYPTLGLHPQFLSHHQTSDISALENAIGSTSLLAIGECGLDFYDRSADRQMQEFFFVEQARLAQTHKLPLIIHARKSVARVIELLADFPNVTGVFHSYSGSYEQAKVLMKKGFFFGFGGPVTWPNSHRLHKLVTAIPLESILLETDAPDQPDTLHRGERNEPSFLPDIAQAIAELKGVPLEDLIQASSENARALFGLS